MKYQVTPEMVPVAAYIAGMIDADGHIAMRGPKRMELVVTNTHWNLMQWLATHTGVTVGEISKRKGLCLPGCIEEHVHSRKQVYRWVVRGHRASIIGWGIAPYMIEKRERLLKVLEQEHLVQKRRYVAQITQEMKELGWVNAL